MSVRETARPGAGQAASDAARQGGTALALLVAGTFFMENLDGTVIATALPELARSFDAAPVDLNIGMSAYLLTLGVFIPLSGWVADRYGARRVFAAAIALFTLASVVCGLAGGIATFVAARILQGIGGAMMVPVGRLVVLRTTPKERLITAIATLTWPALVAPILGPPVGGFLTEHASWRWIFFLNLPLGALALIFALKLVPRGGPSSRRPFDWPGFFGSAIGIASASYAADLVGRNPAPLGEIVGFGLVGVVLISWSIRHFRRAAHPLLDLGGLRHPSFAVSIYGGSLFRIAIGAIPFLLPLLFQVGFGFSPFDAGLMMMAVFAGNLSMKPATTSILRRYGFRTVLVAAGAANVATIAACALLTAQTPIPVICALLFVGGLCRSMQFTATNTIAFADIPPEGMTSANTLFSTAFQLSAGLGISVGAIALRTGEAVTGTSPAAFPIAFLVVAGVAFLGILDSLKLAPDTGLHVTRRS